MNTSCRRRDFLKLSGLGAAAALWPAWVRAAAPTASGKKPNFLVILVDDMGFSDAGCYGGDIQTPNLDRLAANGLRFTQFYNAGRCWPSRACLLSGYYAQEVRRDALPGVGGGNGDIRPQWAHLLPNLLKPQGYRSYHSGKWHVDGTPAEGGFDRAYERSDTNHHFLQDKDRAKIEPPLQPPPAEGYYASTAIADQTIRQLREHAEKYADRPFFAYLAFTEPHFPVQALQEDINRYRDHYRSGWDVIRQRRQQRMTELGIINCPLSKLEPDVVPGYNLNAEKLSARIGPGEVGHAIPWEQLTPEQKEFQATKMAIHAAMIDRVDREIGRVVEQLQAMNAFDNTVIFFASDNGASAEQIIRGDGHDRNAPLGSAKTFVCLGPGWSSAANTPLRLHKSWVHEGGISTPLIVQWPEGIAARGEWRHDVGHLVDLAPTLLELAGGQWPEKLGGFTVPPRPGRSLVPAFTKDGTVTRDYLWWSHVGNRALRAGDWKLVSRINNHDAWELYDLRMDRCESNNLAAKYPDKVQALAKLWERSQEEFRKVAMLDGGEPARGGQQHEEE
ncbi:MAG: arylsulfatase [Verrucomicrobia bacterium]|nr:MAG: arylsulfatase [Verrucomicrobiota bacterium]